jgi:hypothetical protein
MNQLDTGPAAGLLVLLLLVGAAPLPALAQDVPMDRGDAPFPPREAFRFALGASMGSGWFRDYSLTVRTPPGRRTGLEAGVFMAGPDVELSYCDGPECYDDDGLQLAIPAAESVAFLVRIHRNFRPGSAGTPTFVLGAGPVTIRRQGGSGLDRRRIGVMTEMGVAVPMVRGGRWTAEAGLRAMPLATGMPGTRLDRPMGFIRVSWALRVAKD